jgi:hypothetical protein
VRITPDTTGGPRTYWCTGLDCDDAQASSGPDADEIEATNRLPLYENRQTPVGETWSPQTVLNWDWNESAPPPSWMRSTIREAADDADVVHRARVPWFLYRDGSPDTFRYTTSFPDGCSTSIACASRNVPHSWTIRFRPQGYEFRWGSMRWCQANLVNGCIDVERVALHEIGHVFGLRHPEDLDFRMRPPDTVMHQLVPTRPNSGWSMKAFGRCDIAAFQESYGTPLMATPISTCEDIDTRVTLTASASTIDAGDTVVFRARLKTANVGSYGQLANMPLNDRSVQLRRRRVGLSGGWSTYWMSMSGDAPGEYRITLSQFASFDYQAVFPAPDNEGLNGDSSDVVTVRTTTGCASNCGDVEDGE